MYGKKDDQRLNESAVNAGKQQVSITNTKLAA